MNYRPARIDDLPQLKELAIASWSRFEPVLSHDNWEKLASGLKSDDTYKTLLSQSAGFVTESEAGEIIGMAFLVPRGHPTEIFESDWSYIRFLTVHPLFERRGIGRQLANRCIELAKKNNEQTIALHTSEFMGNARRLYESLGFVQVKELPMRLGKRYWLYKLLL